MRKALVDLLLAECLKSEALLRRPALDTPLITSAADIPLLFNLVHKHCGILSPAFTLGTTSGESHYLDVEKKCLLVPNNPSKQKLSFVAYWVIMAAVSTEYNARGWSIMDNLDKVTIWAVLSGFGPALKQISELNYADIMEMDKDMKSELEPLLMEHNEECDNPLCFIHSVMIPSYENLVLEKLEIPSVTRYTHEELLYLLELVEVAS